MGIKYNEDKKYYVVTYSRRHPITREPKGLRRQGIKSREEAERAYRELIVKMSHKFNEVIDPLWHEVVNKFLINFSNRGVANNTLLNYKSSLETHTFEKWGGTRINKITTSQIRDLILDDLAHFSESHRKSMLKFIKAVFRFALESDILQRDPTPKLRFKVGEKIKKVLTENEVKLFLKEAKVQNHSWFPIWAIACFTGMRSGELYALRWERVDLNKRVMVICTSWTKENGFKETKSGDDRIVEIAPSLLPLMLELQKRNYDGYVLPRIREWTTGCQAKVIKEFLGGLELPLIRFHDLRASWATIMLSKGIEPIKVMSMGGWKDLKTMQIYIRKSGIHIQGITNSLNFL
jgi:integrase